MLKQQVQIAAIWETLKSRASDDEGTMAENMMWGLGMAVGAVSVTALIIAWANGKVAILP